MSAFRITSRWPAHRDGITRCAVPDGTTLHVGDEVELFDPDSTFTRHPVEHVYADGAVRFGAALPRGPVPA